jgi:hypothetical protein
MNSKKLSGITKNTRLTIDFQNIPRVNELFAILPQTLGVKTYQKNNKEKTLTK